MSDILFSFVFLQVWFQNRRSRLRREMKAIASRSIHQRSPSYEEFSPTDSASSSRPSSTEPVSPEYCQWSSYSTVQSSSPVNIPSVPSPPRGRCREPCCSPPPIALSPTYFNFNNLATCNFEDDLWPDSLPFW